MSKITQEIKQRIQLLANERIKTLLLTHLVENAEDETNLFSKNYPYDRPAPTFSRACYTLKSGLTYELVLNTVFVYAPTPVCNEIADALLETKNEEMVNLLSAKNKHHNDNQADEWVIQTLIQHAPTETKSKIVPQIKALKEHEILDLLFGTSSWRDFHNFIKLINIIDEETSISLISALDRINKKILFGLFQTSPFPVTTYDALIDLFQEKPKEKLALAVIKILDKYEDNDLKELVFGGNLHYLTRGGTNLLHVVFEFQSEQVIAELLSLVLRKLDEKDLMSLLTHRTIGANKTPLELAFQRQDNMAVAITIARLLHEHPSLNALLTNVSISQFHSPMHLAAINNNIEAVAFFLEQPDSPIDHCTRSTSKTMLNLVEEHGHQNIVTLFHALPIYKLICGNPNPSQNELTIIADLIKKHPAILTCRWTGQKTLLHHAASRGITSLVSLLLSEGASPDSIDVYGNTPLDEALRNNHSLTIQSFTRAQTSTSELSIKTLATSLDKINNPKISYDTLQRTLQQTKQGQALIIAIENYSQQKNDAFIFFLVEVARLASETQKNILINAIKTFLQKNLHKLQENSPLDELENNAIQLQLVILIFSMTPTLMSAVLSCLKLDDEAKKQLGFVLSCGLVQPAIFSRFSLITHQLYYQLIKSLFPEDADLIQSIACIHFQNSDLTLLPPEILQGFATVLSKEALLSLTKQRLNPALLVLALEKLLVTDSTDQITLNALFGQLKNELVLFNTENSLLPDSELQLMLNLTCHPDLKTCLRNIFSEMGADTQLKRRIKQLFTNYKKDIPLLPNSLLREIFIDYANCYDVIKKSQNHQAFTEILAIATPTEVIAAIKNLQTALQPTQFVSSLLTPVLSSSKDELANLHLAPWLSTLENRRQRLAIAPLIEHLDQLYSQIQRLGNLDRKECLPLNDALKKLAINLDEVSTMLFQKHLTHTCSAWDKILEATLKNLNLGFENVAFTLNEVRENPNFKMNYPEVNNELEKLITNDAINSITSDIESTCKKIDLSQYQLFSYIDKALNDEVEENPLKQLFNSHGKLVPPDRREIFIHTAIKKYTNTEQILREFNQAILQGILSNPQRQQLLEHFLNWSLSCGSTLASQLVFSQVPKLARTSQVNNWDKVAQHINELLSLRNYIGPIIIDLQLLTLSPTTIAGLLTTLYETDEVMLNQLIELCSQAQLHAFKAIVSYVLAGKKQNIPLNILKIHDARVVDTNISPWIQHTIEVLESYSSQAISLKILKEGLYCEEEDVIAHLSHVNQLIEENSAVPYPDAINLLVSSYLPRLKKNINPIEIRAFILSLSGLFKNLRSQVVNGAINQMMPEMLNLVINHCLSGLNSDDKLYDQACRYLLTNLCQIHDESNNTALQQIKSCLGHQDLTLLGDDHLIVIAKDILSKTDNTLSASTLNGVWIQRLLTSPRFVAASTPKTIQSLIERYRLISLTLKQDEFEQLNRWIRGKLAFYNHHHQSMTRLEQSILQDPKRRTYLLKKRERLLSFRADDSIRALLNQLEDHCFELKETHPEVAESALEILYTHYNNSLSGLRSDLLFKVADFIINRASRDKGDIYLAQNNLLTWLKHYLPHKNFEQSELSRKHHVSIYNAEGQKIGFINEANHAMTFIDDEPCSLLEVSGVHPGMQLYDRRRCVMGTLALTGEVKRENLFQKNTSALLVAKVPADQFAKSPAALELLMTDIFTENTLSRLYLSSDSDKHSWIEKQVNLFLINTHKPIHQDNLQIIVKQHVADSVFCLLENIQLPQNAAQLFNAILDNQNQRDELFSPARQKSAFEFFKHQDLQILFANFLQNHHDKPWFKDGLQLFANFAQSSGQPELLVNSLLKLNERTYTKKLMAEKDYDAILTTLINSESCASLVWHYFLNASTKTVQQVDSNLSEVLTNLFYKHHCISSIKSLNKQTNWSENYQYRLLLLIFAKQHKQIFQQSELRYSEKQAWTSGELQEISTFIKRHLQQSANPDENFSIGKKLISELVFRCANFGQIQFFYDNQGRFDPTIAGQMIERSYLHAIAARNYLPLQFKKKVKGFISILRGWFDNQYQENQELIEMLKKNQALIDWKDLSNQTWEMNDSMTKLPLISAYLINYSGSKEPLVKLIKDYFSINHFKTNPNILHHVSQVMAKFPTRDISACLFTTLEEIIIKDPTILDETLLSHMSQFHMHRCGKILQSPHAEYQLIKHFGLQKQYAVVQQCCQLLINSKQDASTKLLHKINTEAKVEQQLFNCLGKWYFSIFQFVKRLWYYGFNGIEKPSNIVSFCDVKTIYQPPIKAPSLIRTPILGGQTVAAHIATAKKLKEVKQRYSRFLEKQQKKELSGEYQKRISLIWGSGTQLGLFGKPVNQENNDIHRSNFYLENLEIPAMS